MTIKHNPPRLTDRLMTQPYVLLVLASLFWGGNTVAGKAAPGNIDPYALTLLRWVGAIAVLAPFAIAPLKRDWAVIRAKWWLYLCFGTIGLAVFNVFLYLSAFFTSGVNMGLDQVAINIFVLLLNFALFRQRVQALQLLGVAVTIAGVALTATHGDLARLLALDVNFGDLLVLGACLAYAVYSILLRWRPDTDWTSFLIACFTGSVVASLVFIATFGGGLPHLVVALTRITPLGWLIAAYTVIFPSILSQLFYARGLQLIGANRASLFINLIPLFGAIGAVLVLGEGLLPFHFMAAGLIVTGIVLAEWSARRSQPRAGRNGTSIGTRLR
jgi:drug/metabolite transporter (DMT)-like permease